MKYKLLFAALALVLLLTSCAEFNPPSSYENLPDAYLYESDAPINFRPMSGMLRFVPGKGGYYCFVGDLLHFFDEESMGLVPLCNRPECPHWDSNCPAYFQRELDSLLQYYEGRLYISTYSYDENGNASFWLYEVNPNDCTRRVIGQLPFSVGDYPSYTIHRGYFYAYYHDVMQKTVNLYRIALSESDSSDVLEMQNIYSKAVDSFIYPYFYGSHVFLAELHFDENQHLLTQWFDLNLNTLEIKPVTLPDVEEGGYTSVDGIADVDGMILVNKLSKANTLGENLDIEYFSYDIQDGSSKELIVFPDHGTGISEFMNYDGQQWIAYYFEIYPLLEEFRNKGQTLRLFDRAFQETACIPIDFPVSDIQIGDEKFTFLGEVSENRYIFYVLDKRNGANKLIKILDADSRDFVVYKQ